MPKQISKPTSQNKIKGVLKSGGKAPSPAMRTVKRSALGHVATPSTPTGNVIAWTTYRNSFLDSTTGKQISEIRKGASARNLVGIAEAIGVPREIVFDLVGLSASTAKRKLANDDTLDSIMTERLTRIGAIEKMAEDVFNDAAIARSWLKGNNTSLGNVSPLSMLDTEIGSREVSRVLTAIAYGGVA